MRWRLLAGALAGLVLLTGGCSPSETATPPASQPPPPRFLLQQNLAGDRGPLLVTVDQEVYPPHSAGLWHSHPGPGSFCVLQGRLTVQVRDQPDVPLAAGSCWPEPAGVVHRPANLGDRQAVALFYLLASADQPRIIAAPATPR